MQFTVRALLGAVFCLQAFFVCIAGLGRVENPVLLGPLALGALLFPVTGVLLLVGKDWAFAVGWGFCLAGTVYIVAALLCIIKLVSVFGSVLWAVASRWP